MSRTVMALSLFILGCQTVRPIVGPDGSTNQLIGCTAVEQCYDKAREVCGNYQIINTSTESSGANSSVVKILVKCDQK